MKMQLSQILAPGTSMVAGSVDEIQHWNDRLASHAEYIQLVPVFAYQWLPDINDIEQQVTRQ